MAKWFAASVFMLVVALASFALALLLQAQSSPFANTLLVAGWQLLAVVMGVMCGGSLSLLAGVIALLRAIRADKDKMTAIETFYALQSGERKKAIRQGVELLKESALLLDEATDDIPLQSKPEYDEP